MLLRISERSVGEVVILDLEGRIVMGEESKLLVTQVDRILAQGTNKILLNIGAVKYIDSSGLWALCAAFTETQRHSGAVKLINSDNPKVRDLLQITKMYTIFEVFGDEMAALQSFSMLPLRCACPVCGSQSGPPLVDRKSDYWHPQTCTSSSCGVKFSVVSSQWSQAEYAVKSLRIGTYKDEYIEIVLGQCFEVRIVGRLDLFSLSGLRKVWAALPATRRVLFDLHQMTEIDDAGHEGLIALSTITHESAQAVISLEGLNREQMRGFPASPPFYASKATALAALGSAARQLSWPVKVVVG